MYKENPGTCFRFGGDEIPLRTTLMPPSDHYKNIVIYIYELEGIEMEI